MLLNTYDPDSEAKCPKCGLVRCQMTGGNLAFSPRHLDFRHSKCGTEWRMYIDDNRVELLKEPEET